MQSANKAFWKDILIYNSKDVPWKIKCQRLVDHVCAIFASGSENWSWIIQTLEKIKGWETKTMIRLFVFERQTEETWVGYNTRTCNVARKIWVQMRFHFYCTKKLQKVWRAVGWVCDGKVDTVTNSLKKVYKWRSTTWWHSLQTRMMEEDPDNRTRWKHKW